MLAPRLLYLLFMFFVEMTDQNYSDSNDINY